MTSRKKRSLSAKKGSHEFSHERSSFSRVSKTTRKSNKWNDDEDDRLKDLRSRGLSWQDVEESQVFSDKSGNACRKRFERLLETAKLEQIQNGISMDELSEAYTEVRKEMWAIVAGKLNIKNWEVLEKLSFEWGLLTLKRLAKDHRHALKNSENQSRQATAIAHEPRLRTSAVSDEEDTQSSSTDSASSQHTSPLPSPQQDQDFRATYYTHNQSLPVLPEPSPYSAPTRQLSHLPQLPHHQSSHYPYSPSFTLPAMQPHGYASTPLQRPMVQENEYSLAIRYRNVSDPLPPYRNSVLHPSYHQQMTTAARHEELPGEKMSVQSILSEPCDLRQSYS